MRRDNGESITRILCRISIISALEWYADYGWHEVVALLSEKEMHWPVFGS